ncbi:3-deoxy-7-phosphoheptulonate synthase [Nocardia abscessus]|uniref:3-deoxy-7-phosphoheptulonate synthase n=1 Tax=Nocardia abscessus TaxID=120957 RepID=UPI0018947AD2|nr:3-deoxy-7-phosphoheptulonate synthase [Nocardia abscessus]MBF6339336.1 3-deoxy-7-phosphoheptulonate synthase [Nocardia abscessus]
MTITHTGPEPPGDCPPGGSGLRKQGGVERFRHPLTRMLLGSDGFTTPVLAAILGTELQIRVLRQDDIAAGRLPSTVTEALRVSGADRLIVRRSCLVNADLVTASVNYVVAVRGPAAASGVDDVRVAIGSGLISRGMSQRRQLLRTGVTRWPDGRMCAARSYVMLLGDRPLCYIRESFNPSVVPPAYAPATDDDPPWADEPERAEPGSFTLRTALPATQEPTGNGRTDTPPATLWGRVRRSRPLPALVHPEECETLTAGLARAVSGRGFVLHLGGSGDRSTRGGSRAVDARRALIYAAAAVMAHGSGEPVVAIERAAVRYPGPRWIPDVLGPAAASFVGAGTDDGSDLPGRTPDPVPKRSVRAARDGLRGDRLPLTLCVNILRRAADRCHDPVRRDLLREVGGLLPLAAIAPPGAHELHSSLGPLHVSREPVPPDADILPPHSAHRRGWDRSAHLLWIGAETRQAARAQVRFAAGVGNPVAVALGPTTTPHEVEFLCRTLNPQKVPGRLTLVPGLSAACTRDRLPALFDAATACGTPVCWVFDPLPHAPRTRHGHLPLLGEVVIDGIRAFFQTCRATGTVPGGLHLECAPETVVERNEVRDERRTKDCRSRHGPGLDPAQTLQCVIAALESRAA